MKICPICNKECKQITAQHIFKHQLTIKEFKEKYPTVDLGNDNTKIVNARLNQERKIIEEKQAVIDNIKCIQCGKLITSTDRKERKFCSHTCRAYYSNRYRPEREHICLYCKQSFKSKSHYVKYCSHKCSCEHKKRRIIIKCCFCGKDFERIIGHVQNKIYVFCSNKCKNQFFHLPENKHIRGTYAGYKSKSYIRKYRQVALEVYGKKCFYCGYNRCDGALQVHHIDCNNKNNDIKNLRVVCCNCHAEEHLGLK